MRASRKKLSLGIALILTAALFSNIAAAAGAGHWAEDPVNKLNTIYGPGTFSTSYELPVTAGDVKQLLSNAFGYSDLSGYVGIDGAADDAAVTRGVLAHTLVKLFKLGDIAGADDAAKIDSAIVICRNAGIMSGYSPEEFGRDNSINHGEFAAGFFRAVNKAAGGTMANKWGLVPGTFGYEELLYFLVRGIPFGENVYSTTFDDGFSITVGSETFPNAEAVWGLWNNMLTGLGYAVANVSFENSEANGASTVYAVTKAVEYYRDALRTADMNTDIFYDVPVSSWFYDGIMYLLNQKIVTGYGNGSFGPYNPVTRFEMALLVLRAKGVIIQSLPMPSLEEFTEYFVPDKFLDGSGNLISSVPVIWAAKEFYGPLNDFDPGSILTREEMAYTAIMLYEEYDPDNVNLAVLDRFADKDDIEEAYKRPIAYLVSIGVLKGSPGEDGICLSPKSECTRAEAGVFMARVLQGLDKSKMKDYENAVNYVLSGGGD